MTVMVGSEDDGNKDKIIPSEGTPKCSISKTRTWLPWTQGMWATMLVPFFNCSSCSTSWYDLLCQSFLLVPSFPCSFLYSTFILQVRILSQMKWSFCRGHEPFPNFGGSSCKFQFHLLYNVCVSLFFVPRVWQCMQSYTKILALLRGFS